MAITRSTKRGGMKKHRGGKTKRGGMHHGGKKTRRGGMKHKGGKTRRGGMKHKGGKTRRGGMKHGGMKRGGMMHGGLRPLTPADVNAPAFVPKGVPVVPPGGGSVHGAVDGHKYYNLAKPSLGAPNHSLEQSKAVQSGGGIIPQPLVQLGRGLMYNLENLYNTSQGAQTYISDDPNVLRQRLSTSNDFDITPIDMNAIETTANTKAASLKPYGV